ncbi:hypothetical protein DL96DRAFT_1675973 [Flagelloscypha sp. PMI_526]|nr:hypothetical protein DL96DRAFT_1675973 [Flagelloscypha sp. PMI_526]
MAAIPISEATGVIRDMIVLMSPEPDYQSIAGADDAFHAREQQIKKDADETLAVLKTLSASLAAARKSSQRPDSASAQDHEDTLQDLDETRTSLMKAISDADSALGSKEHELSKLKEESRQLESYDPAAEHEKMLDSTPLRLQLYKKIGFEPMVDKDGNQKFLIRTLSGDIRVAELYEDESRCELATRLFTLAEA